MTLLRGHDGRVHHLLGLADAARACSRPWRPARSVGVVNGTLIAKLKMPPFIATLGMMLVAKGLALVISGTQADLLQRHRRASRDLAGFAARLISCRLRRFPNAVLILFVAAIVAAWSAQQDRARALHLRARQQRGGDAALRRQRRPLEDHHLRAGRRSSAASPACCIASRLNSAQPALGQGYELDAIAAVVIGGTSLSGGEGTHPRHRHRRVHHQRADQRPAHPVGAAGMADRRHRRSSSSSPSTLDILRRRRA